MMCRCFVVLVALLFGSCRTTKTENERAFADGKSSKDVVAGVQANPRPPSPTPPLPPDPFPQPNPVENGAFYKICKVRDQLPSPQAFTVKALLNAVHQLEDCAAGETWLRDTSNHAIMIESAPLVELQTLTLLEKYPHLADIYIKVADGVDRRCPVAPPQSCHWRDPIP